MEEREVLGELSRMEVAEQESKPFLAGSEQLGEV